MKKKIELFLKNLVYNSVGIQPTLTYNGYCVFKCNNNYCFCKVDVNRLYNYQLDQNVYQLKDFVIVIKEFKSKQNPLKAISKYFQFKIPNTTSKADVINVFYKNDNNIQIAPLCFQNNKLIYGCWLEI